MLNLGKRTLVRTAGLLAIGVLAYAASVVTTTEQVRAQIDVGDYWLFQPQQTGPVGRAYCNAGHTAEYWAYTTGEYRFPNSSNGPGNRGHIDFERVSGGSYATYAAFKTAVRALPEMAGKTILFQNHSVAEETITN